MMKIVIQILSNTILKAKKIWTAIKRNNIRNVGKIQIKCYGEVLVE